jgi:hypothetical protein
MYLVSRLSRNLSQYAALIAMLLIFSLIISISARIIGYSIADYFKSQSVKSNILFLDSNAYNFREYIAIIEHFRAHQVNLKIKYVNKEKYENNNFDIIITDNIADIRDLHKMQLLSTIENAFITIKQKEVVIYDYYIEVIDSKSGNILYIALKANLAEKRKYFQMEIVNYILNYIFKNNNK